MRSKSKGKTRNLKKIKFASVMCIVVVITAAIIAVKASNEGYYNNTQKCDPGYYMSGGRCVRCPGGSYCNNNKKYACPKGMGSLSGSRYEFECDLCAKGYYSKGDGKGCVACPKGTYQNKAGQASCVKCSAGTYQSKTGQASCVKCSTGTYQNKTGQTSCIKCGAGTYQSKTGQTSCVKCSAGTYQNKTGQASCIKCSAGTYQNNVGQKSCINCSTGTYQNKTGQTSCIKCSAGTYQNKIGQKTCIKCSAGTYQNNVGRTSCITCNKGTYQDKTGQKKCITCPAGTTTKTVGATSCSKIRTCKESTDPKDSGYNECIKNSPVLKLSKTIKKLKVGESVTIHVTLPNCGTFDGYTRISHGGSGNPDRWYDHVDQEYKNTSSTGYDWVITGKKRGSTCLSQTVQYDVVSPSGKCAANIKSMVNMCINVTN